MKITIPQALTDQDVALFNSITLTNKQNVAAVANLRSSVMTNEAQS